MKTLASVCGLLVIAAGALSVPAPRRQAPGPTVPENIVALLKKRCVDCHSGSKPAESLNLEPDRILAASLDRPAVGDPARKLIDAAAPEKSYLLAKVKGDRDIRGSRMPVRQARLPEPEIELLRDWILSLKGTDR